MLERLVTSRMPSLQCAFLQMDSIWPQQEWTKIYFCGMCTENVKTTLFCKGTRMRCWKSLGTSTVPSYILWEQIRWCVSGMPLYVFLLSFYVVRPTKAQAQGPHLVRKRCGWLQTGRSSPDQLLRRWNLQSFSVSSFLRSALGCTRARSGQDDRPRLPSHIVLF